MSSIRTRRTVAGATAAALALTGAVVSLAGPAGAVSSFELTRLAGPDRYATAAAIARSSFPNTDVALLANGQSDDPRTSRNESHFPDALAGSYLAGARTAPTLLTTETALPAATETALSDLGVSTVVILGGTAAVSAAQEQQLEDDGYTVQRVSGTNRYATAAAIARAPGSSNVGTVGGARTAVVASGVEFPDALVMGPLSYASRLPLTITDPQRLSPETRSVLTDLDIDQVLIPGGTSAVSAGVQAEIESLGITVRRFEGSTRTQTATLVAEYALSTLGFSDAHINLALGLRFPDALSGGPHAGRDRAPILLTAGVDALGTAARDFLADQCSTLQNGHIFGGTSAVSTSVENDAEEAARSCGGTSPSPSPTTSASPSPTTSASPSPTVAPLTCAFSSGTPSFAEASDSQTVTTLPELTVVEFGGDPRINDAGTLTAADDFCTVDVRFTFDEPVIGKAPVASGFTLIGFDPTVRFSGQRALVESGGTTVLVTFGQANDTTTTADERQSVGAQQLEGISVAAVDRDSVADNSGQGNPVNERPFGISRETLLFKAGITRAPDLLVVRSETSTANIAFDFDEPPVIVRTTGFHVITSENRDVTCTSPAASGQTVRATCAVTTGETIARGYAESGSVSDTAQNTFPGADGNLNVLQAADLQEPGSTVAPDLVSAEFGDFTPGGSATNTVLFTFDEPVFVGNRNSFVVYQEDTDEFRSTDAVRQTDTRQVLATFATDDEDGNPATARVQALENAVGVSVLGGAVIQAGGQNLPNQEDELAVQNPTTVGVTAGLTTGPDLTGVTLTQGNSASATYRFDETLLGQVTFSAFALRLADGTRLTCSSGSQTSLNEIRCTAFTTTLFGLPAPATPDQIASAVLGVVDNAAVRNTGGRPNPEGAEDTAGGTGTPRQ